MSYEALRKEIAAGRTRNLYLFYGFEKYLIRHCENELKKLILSTDTMEFNYNLVEGAKDAGELFDLCASFPMFSERRLVVMRNPGVLTKGGKKTAKSAKGAKGAKKHKLTDRVLTYEDVIGGLPDFTCLLIIEDGEPDVKSPLFKLIESKGLVVEFKKRTPQELEKWVLAAAGRDKKAFTREALRYFMENAGESMIAIKSELDKLLMYTADKNGITLYDVTLLCGTSLFAKIFDLIDYMAGGDKRKAMEELRRLLRAGEPPPRIMSTLAGHITLLRQLKSLTASGMRQSEIIRFTGLHPYRAEKIIRQSARMSTEQLTQAIEMFHRHDKDTKAGRMSDTLALELSVAGMR